MERKQIKKSTYFWLLLLFVSSVQAQQPEDAVKKILNNWHQAAAESQLEKYFEALTPNAIFIGTDATERWVKPDFYKYAKPHFLAKRGWKFTPISQNVIYSPNGKIAWFDELLNTQMKICRGSGVAIKTKKGWKIAHYVLSMTIPNEVSSEVIKTKSPIENALLLK